VGQTQTFRSPTAVVVWIVWLLFAVGNGIDLAVQGRDHASAVAAAILLLATGAVYVAAQRPRIIADDAGLTIRNPLRDHQIGWAAVTKVDLAELLRVHCQGGPGGPGESGGEGSPQDRGGPQGGLGGKVPPQDRGGPGGSPPPGKHSKVIHAWAVPYSRRRRFAAEVKARRVSGPRRSSLGSFGLPSGGGGRGLPYGATASGPRPGASAAEAEAETIARVLSERATAAQAEAVWASGTVEIAEAQGTTRTEGTTGTQAASPAVLDAIGRLEPLRSTWSGRAIAALVIPALTLLIVCLV
jgi:hypothetical protein